MEVDFYHRWSADVLSKSNPVKASKMEDYLRNQFSFAGIMSQERSEMLKSLKDKGLNELASDQKRSLVQQLWEDEYRESQLLALEWMMQWKPTDYLESDLEFFEDLILQKSWWDTVDGIAPNLIGKYAKRFPEKMNAVWNVWENHPSFWIRRSCLIFQLRYRQETDLVLLRHFIHSCKTDKEFFIQKAIGWSLREVSKWNPHWVKEVVEEEELKGLARREAIKYVGYL
jgi:3-methyladenine DNA glycosylase AlkD